MHKFEPTHVINTPRERILVRADLDANGFGPLYTRQEWESATAADWELTYRGLLLQGRVVDGSSFARIRSWIVAATHDAFGREGAREYRGTERGARRAAWAIARRAGHGWLPYVSEAAPRSASGCSRQTR